MTASRANIHQGGNLLLSSLVLLACSGGAESSTDAAGAGGTGADLSGSGGGDNGGGQSSGGGPLTQGAGGSGETGGQPNDAPSSSGGSSDSAAGGTSSQGECSGVAWPAAEPSSVGPFETVTEENTGPVAGDGADDAPTDFTIFRPAELGAEGRCHPVVTWGNGTSASPALYAPLLNHLASHGFIVIASNNPNVARGTPPPMVAGVTWLAEQNADPTSPYFGHVDTERAGATGHSQGGMATTSAGTDPAIKTIAPLCGAGRPMSLSGPALLLCGGMDTIVTCESVEAAYSRIDNQPKMLANFLAADHADWITFRGTNLSPMELSVVAWMRVHLMDDDSLRDWFYGANCHLCDDSDWAIQRTGMDE